MNYNIVMAPSPQQAFNGQGVLRIPGYRIKFCCLNFIVLLFYKFIILFLFYLLNILWYLFLLLLLCGDVEVNPGPCRSKCRVMYSNIRGLYANINDLQIASRNYDIIFCSETLVSSKRHVSELLLPGFNKPTLILSDSRARARGLATYIRSGYSASIIKDFVCNCHEVQLVKVCSRSNNFYIFNLYRNPDIDNRIYDCLLTSMNDIQEHDRKSAFVFVGDLNAHHREWLNSSTETDSYGRAAYNFATISGCAQLINEPTRGNNCLDLLLTDVPGVVDSAVKPPLGTADHSVISFTLKLSFSIPNVQFTRKVLLKSRIDWDRVTSDIRSIVWSDIYNSPDPIVQLNNILVTIINRRVPTKIIKSRLKDKAWFNSDCVKAFNDKQSAYRLWTRDKSRLLWDNYVWYRNHAKSVFDAAQSEYKLSVRESLSEATDAHKWWSHLKSFLFGINTTLPPIRTDDGSVTFDPSVMAEVFSSVFQRKQSSQELNLPPTCFPEPKLTHLAFKSKELKRYLEDLDSLGGSDPNDIFPLFLKKNSGQLAPKLAVVFRRLLALGSFPEAWRSANVTPIPKGSTPTQFPLDYRPISITPILSKLYEKLIYRRLFRFVTSKNILPPSQFGFRKGLGTTDALLKLTHDLQYSLDKGAESRVISLDFSSAFDLVNHQALLYKLKSMGVGGPIFDVLEEFLANRKQRVCVDGHFSRFQTVVSGVPQGSVLGPLLFILYTADLELNLENKIISYADDTTLYAEVASPAHRTRVAESLNRDLLRIHEWCLLWGMKLNPSKTHSILVSRSRTPDPPHPPLILCGTSLDVSNSLKLLGITIDNKLTFEKHIRSVAASIAQKTGILRKCYRTLGQDDALIKSFYAFILPCFEYCAPVWCSAADTHLKLLDRALNNIRFLLPNISLDLEHRRKVSGLSMLYKIFHNTDHPLNACLPAQFIPARRTRYTVRLNDYAFSEIHPATKQYKSSFLPYFCKLWNSLPNETFQCSDHIRFRSLVNTFLNSS